MTSKIFPLPLGSALRWAAKQRVYLEDEGYGTAVLDAVQPLLARYAHHGNEGDIALAHRLLAGDQ